jgi:hypothetical protein
MKRLWIAAMLYACGASAQPQLVGWHSGGPLNMSLPTCYQKAQNALRAAGFTNITPNQGWYVGSYNASVHAVIYCVRVGQQVLADAAVAGLPGYAPAAMTARDIVRDCMEGTRNCDGATIPPVTSSPSAGNPPAQANPPPAPAGPDMMGTWLTSGSFGASLWRLSDRRGNSYTAQQLDWGQAAGTAVTTGNTVEIRWRTVEGWEGVETWNLATGQGYSVMTVTKDGTPPGRRTDYSVRRSQ